MDTDIVSADSREQRPLGGDRPSLDMPLEKVGIRMNELRGRLIATIRGETSRVSAAMLAARVDGE